jgi:Fe-S cluster assembly protein SufB
MNKHEIKEIIKQKGINEKIVSAISGYKNEPEWMLELRLKSLQFYLSKKIPTWGADLTHLDENEIQFFVTQETKKQNNWEEVPWEIKTTFEELKIPEHTEFGME